MNPQVTIGIPAWNAERTLRAAVCSVLAQSFEDWKLLILDDGSADRTAEVAADFDDSRIVLVKGETNQGLVKRLNQLVDLTRTRLFARMDADDRMHPERLARQIECFRRDQELVICGTAVYVMDEQEQIYGIRGDDERRRSVGIRGGFVHPTVMGRTEWFRRNPYDPAYVRAEDSELWLRVEADTRCELLPEPLLFYREPLSPQTAKYRTSCRTMRNIVRRYGPERLGSLRTFAALAGLHGKEWLYLAASRTGLSERLIAMRNRSCTPEEQERGNALLATLRQHEKEIHHEYSA